MTQSATKRAILFLGTTLLFDILRFPVWWYTTGVVRALGFLRKEVLAGAANLSLVVLFKNLLKPMYGDYSKTGRAISLFLRLFLFIARLIAFLGWLVIILIFFALWIALPPLAVYLFIRSFRA